jgi:hypothetical protein
MNILAIDNGNISSAFVVWNGSEILNKGILLNHDLLEFLYTAKNYDVCVIERIQSFGMPVGESIFESVHWAGRFHQAAESSGKQVVRIPRKDVKVNLCGSMRAKDGNIRQAIIDRLEPGATPRKKLQGALKGVHADEWSALALSLTYEDSQKQLNTQANGTS